MGFLSNFINSLRGEKTGYLAGYGIRSAVVNADLKKDAADALKQFIDLRTEVSLLNESILKNQERIDKLQNEITKLLSYGKSSGINEKIRLKVAESTGLELHLAELKEDKLRLEKKLEQAKENHSKKYQLLKEKQSEFLKVH